MEAATDSHQGRPSDEWIMLNVGGKIFTTTRTTLCTSEPNSMLARMFSQHEHGHDLLRPSPRDANGAYLIDRSPKYFEPILNYLRHGKLILDHDVNVQGVLEEAKFFGIVSLLPMLELETERWFKKRHHDLIQSQLDYENNQLLQHHHQQQQRHQHHHHLQAHLQCQQQRHQNNLNQEHQHLINNNNNDDDVTNNNNLNYNNDNLQQYQRDAPAELTRRDVIKALIATSGDARGLRFQGCNLTRVNLSRLDLRYINFKYANMRQCDLRGANLSCANLERANLQGANLDGSQIAGANLANANLSNSNLRAVSTLCPVRSPLDGGGQYMQAAGPPIDTPPAPLAGDNHHHHQAWTLETNFEGANMRNVNMEGSRLVKAYFHRAVMQGANLQNCDLTQANFGAADLENCDLSGSQVTGAHLREAKTKNARFEPEVT